MWAPNTTDTWIKVHSDNVYKIEKLGDSWKGLNFQVSFAWLRIYPSHGSTEQETSFPWQDTSPTFQYFVSLASSDILQPNSYYPPHQRELAIWDYCVISARNQNKTIALARF